eukprot:scaffold88007_cov15-Prasinocladus_malaysianus.AAC.1
MLSSGAMQDMSLLSTDMCEVNLEMPYISGFLGFRECPAFQQLLSRVKGTALEPQARKTQFRNCKAVLSQAFLRNVVYAGGSCG